MENGIVDAKSLDERALILRGIADGAQNTQEVQPGDSILMPEFLHRAGEDLGDGEGSCDRWREADELLQRLKHVLEGGLRQFGGGVG